MSWHFRPLAIGEKTHEPIQGEFFSTEAIHNPTEALVREGIQNSLDAGTELPVRVRLFLASGQDAAPASRMTPWLKGAWEHIQANGNGLREPPSESDACPFLVFEDFGTRGLQGDVDQAFDEPGVKNHFFYFFRAEGRSGKSELDRGRWGIRIQRKDVRVLLKENEGALSFDANLNGLTDYDLPPDASVFVEAYRQTVWMRFPFGSLQQVEFVP
jgi:hypothetical protein